MCLRVNESRVKSSYYHYHTTLSSHEFGVFNALGGSVDKSSPTFFVFVCLCPRNSIAIFHIEIK